MAAVACAGVLGIASPAAAAPTSGGSTVSAVADGDMVAQSWAFVASYPGNSMGLAACAFHAGFLRSQTGRNYMCTRAGSYYHLLKEL
ncbi:hypothetical protein GA0070607_5861 [Micromonospora coriariae]|uniref:Uncharacterized protein n=2 Tax=Micromonospora coriariae TaxID=285665 RepID=A0A1C4XW54_9ACTN|nr:hypothetical protein GA0070607_5861 [Micromonospora coriariae]